MNLILEYYEFNLSLEDKVNFLVKIAYSMESTKEDYKNLWGSLSSIFMNDVKFKKGWNKDDRSGCPFIYLVDKLIDNYNDKSTSAYKKERTLLGINNLYDEYRKWKPSKYNKKFVEEMLSPIIEMDYLGDKFIDSYEVDYFFKLYDNTRVYNITLVMLDDILSCSVNDVSKLNDKEYRDLEMELYRWLKYIEKKVSEIIVGKFILNSLGTNTWRRDNPNDFLELRFQLIEL